MHIVFQNTKKHYEQNKDKILDQRKAYKELNNDKLAEQYKESKKIETTKKCKGISKTTVEKDITTNDYKNVLLNGVSISKDVYGIRSFDHEVYTTKMKKVALTPYYDKMNMPDFNTCLPFGYYKITKNII